MTIVLVLLLGFAVCTRALQPVYYHYEPQNNSFVSGTLPLSSEARSLRPTFRTDPPTEPFRSHSQEGKQDLMILTIFNDKNDGFFVDLAANDWQSLSNSYVLEYYNNWKGICIEPNPKYLEGLLANRKCTIITSPVGRSNGEILKFRFHKKGEFGGFVGDEFDNQQGSQDYEDKEVSTVTLTNLLDQMNAPRVMDYLSLDVEGAELYVLQGLDHSKYTFLVITIERPKHHSHHILSKHGYRFLYQLTDWGECMYIHQSLPNFVEVMKQYRQNAPPGWMHQPRPYLTHPKWDESYSGEGFTAPDEH